MNENLKDTMHDSRSSFMHNTVVRSKKKSNISSNNKFSVATIMNSLLKRCIFALKATSSVRARIFNLGVYLTEEAMKVQDDEMSLDNLHRLTD